MDLDKGLDFRKKRKFRFGKKAKILSLGLDFEEGRERSTSFESGSIFSRGAREFNLEEIKFI